MFFDALTYFDVVDTFKGIISNSFYFKSRSHYVLQCISEPVRLYEVKVFNKHGVQSALTHGVQSALTLECSVAFNGKYKVQKQLRVTKSGCCCAPQTVAWQIDEAFNLVGRGILILRNLKNPPSVNKNRLSSDERQHDKQKSDDQKDMQARPF